MPVIPFFLNRLRTFKCFDLCVFHTMWERSLASHVTSATVLLGLTLTMGRNTVDLTPAVTRSLVPIDRTKYYCMRDCN